MSDEKKRRHTRAQREAAMMRDDGGSLSARIGWFTGPREPSGCRLWRGTIDSHGYARIQPRSGCPAVLVSRLILGLTKEDARVAMHACDNRACVEPSHLRPGSVAENAHDCTVKGRWNPVRGDSSHLARLTPRDVHEIRRMSREGATYKQISDRLGLAPSTIGCVVRRVSWKHI